MPRQALVRVIGRPVIINVFVGRISKARNDIALTISVRQVANSLFPILGLPDAFRSPPLTKMAFLVPVLVFFPEVARLPQ